MLDLASLPNPDDRLTYVLGNINRDDNFAEGEALSVFWALAAPGRGGATAPRDFARILEGCRTMAKTAGVPDFAREVTLSTLDEAATAHRQRNLLTHDRWMHLPWRKTEQWNSPRRQMTPQGPKVTTRTLDEFVACSDALHRVGWRLRSLWIILPAWLGNDDEFRADANPSAERDYWSSIAQASSSLEQPEPTHLT
jgi:hypothetical protein